jgi:2-polyprenyl-3-methyl-5-hydroxy-6-metoxy-1,4-benzoquinol methylase
MGAGEIGVSLVTSAAKHNQRMKQAEGLVETFPCDLCGQQNEEYLYSRPGVLTGYPFRVVRCRSCGLMYLNPRLGESAIADLYDRQYYEGKGFDRHVSYLDSFSKENDIDKVFQPEETVKIIKQLVPPPAILLDFGCGLGAFMRQAAKQGFSAEGYEVSHFAAAFASANGLKVYNRLEELPHEQYDIVTAMEVLEHCSSPMKALSAIYQCLKPGGVLYYTTANFDGFHRRWRWGIKTPALDGYIVPEGHIHFFSTRVMESYFSKIGYSEVFYFEPRSYEKGGRLYRILSGLGLVESRDAPETPLGRLSYYGARSLATVLGLRRRRLPLARR